MPNRWQHLRTQMPVTDHWAYFDHAAVAPISAPARDVMAEWAADVAGNGDANWSRWRKEVEVVRRDAAKLLAAGKSEIALIRNTGAVLEDLIGPTVTDFLFDADTVFIVLEPRAGTRTKARALVCYNRETNAAFLVTNGLPTITTKSYTLQVGDRGGQMKRVERFASNGGIQGVQLTRINVASLAKARWQIIDERGTAILTSV